MAAATKFSPGGGAGSSATSDAETRRARAFREMLSAGLWSIAGVALIAFAMKAPERHQTLLLIGALPLTFGALRFFHGLWRYLRE